jgi:hypothetical protein
MAWRAANGKMLPDSRRIRLPIEEHRGMPAANFLPLWDAPYEHRAS